MKPGNSEDKADVSVLNSPQASLLRSFGFASGFPVPTEGFSMTSTETTKITATITAARAEINGTEYVPVADCVDWLLDCHNAAERPVVRDVVITLLPQFSNGNLRTTDEFIEALDQIEIALAVDNAFEGTTLQTQAD